MERSIDTMEKRTLSSFNLSIAGQTYDISEGKYVPPDSGYKSNVSVEYVSPFSGETVRMKVLSTDLIGESYLVLHLEDGGSIEFDLEEIISCPITGHERILQN